MIHLYIIINALNSNEKQSRKQCIDFTLCNVYENNAISTVMIYSVSFSCRSVILPHVHV